MSVLLRGLSRCRLLPVVAFTTLLVASSVENAFAGTWIIYDDNGKDLDGYTTPGSYVEVKFTLPGWYSAALLTARFWVKTSDAQSWQFEVHVFDASGYTDLTPPITYTTPTGPFDQFFDLDLSSRRIIVGREFWIAIRRMASKPAIGADTGPLYDRSYDRNPPTMPDWQLSSLNCMIRAEVAQTTVGGYVLSTSALAVLAPYLAAITLIAAAVVMMKRRLD